MHHCRCHAVRQRLFTTRTSHSKRLRTHPVGVALGGQVVNAIVGGVVRGKNCGARCERLHAPACLQRVEVVAQRVLWQKLCLISKSIHAKRFFATMCTLQQLNTREMALQGRWSVVSGQPAPTNLPETIYTLLHLKTVGLDNNGRWSTSNNQPDGSSA